jgi:uncharacterized protein
MVLSARGAAVEREFKLIDLPRMTELAVDDKALARLSARFHLVETRAGIAGRVTANLRLVCQRCLGPVQVLVEDEFHVVLVPSEVEMDRLPDEQDAIIVDAARLDLGWLLEEQLLLAMPLVPVHGTNKECNHETISEVAKADKVMAPGVSGKMAQLETQRPFADLRDLLNQSSTGRPSKARGNKP